MGFKFSVLFALNTQHALIKSDLPLSTPPYTHSLLNFC